MDVHSITMDGASSNLGAMTKFGCKLRLSAKFIYGSFSFEGFNNDLYFFLMLLMLKLARNAMADLGVLVDERTYIKWDFIRRLHELQSEVR